MMTMKLHCDSYEALFDAEHDSLMMMMMKCSLSMKQLHTGSKWNHQPSSQQQHDAEVRVMVDDCVELIVLLCAW